MDCVNLCADYGARYVVKFEESRQGRERDPWLMVLPCKIGHVFPWGGSKLAASVDGYPRLAKRIASLPTARVHQDGDDGTTIVFDVAQFDAVAKIMRPKRRRADFAPHNRPTAALPKSKPASKRAA